MKRFVLAILTLLSFCSPAFSSSHAHIPIGVTLINPSVTVTQLNSDAAWVAWSFIADGAKTINTASFYVSAVSGTLDSDDISVEIYSTDKSTGRPSSALASTTTVSSTPTSASVVTATGLSYSVTAGEQYFIVIKNAAGSPTVNNFTVRRWTGAGNNPLSGGTTTYGTYYVATTDSGSSWTVAASTIMCQVGYSDSSVQGLLLSTNGFTGGTYGTGSSKRHEGVYFVTPQNSSLNVIGFYISLTKNGTPTGDLTAKLRVGASTYTATGTLAPGQTPTVAPFLLSSTVTIPGGSVVRATFENSAEDSASNCYRMPYYFLVDSTVNKALIPMQIQYTLSTDNASTWTETDELVPIGGLILDMSPFPASQSGGAYVF